MTLVAPDQLVLDVDLSAAARIGRHEANLRTSVAAAEHIAADPNAYAAAISLGLAIARALDVAERRGDTLTAGQSARSFSDVLERLGLWPVPAAAPAPAPEVTTDEPAADPLAGWSRPEVVHPRVA